MKTREVFNQTARDNTFFGDWCKKLAQGDIDVVTRWASQSHLVASTQASYRKEGLRFLLWLNDKVNKTLKQATSEDLASYRNFLAAPLPKARWQGPPVPTTDSRWRPFHTPLSATSIRLALTTLGALFKYTRSAEQWPGWVTIDGVIATIPAPPVAQPTIDHDEVCRLAAYIERQLHSAKRGRARYECARWTLHLAYLAGAHREEITQAFMRDISQTATGGIWIIRGTHGRTRRVPVSMEFLRALTHYRGFHGLPPMPAADENTPLVLGLRASRTACKLAANSKRLSYTSLYLLFRTVCAHAADAYAASNPAFSNTLRSLTLDRVRLASERHRLALGESPIHVTLQLGRNPPDLFLFRYVREHGPSPCTQLSLVSDNDRVVDNVPAEIDLGRCALTPSASLKSQ